MSMLVPAGDVAIDAMGLDPDRAAALLAGRARDAAQAIVAAVPGLAALACTIGGERFALPLATVAEVLPAMRPTPVPGAPAALLGLVVWRGLIHNLVDPAAALGVAGGAAGAGREAGREAGSVSESGGRHMLLLRGPIPRIALRIEAAPDTIEIRPLADGASPGGLAGGGAGGVAGSVAGDDGGLTASRIAADGERIALIAPARLIAALGLTSRG